jgi:hypothetical protein
MRAHAGASPLRERRRLTCSPSPPPYTETLPVDFETLAVELDAAEVVNLGLRCHQQGYDVVYFELARRFGVAVAMLDGGMRTSRLN